MATLMHLLHIPIGSIVRTTNGQVGVVLPSVPGKRILELLYRENAPAGTQGKSGTYQLTISLHDQVELIETPTKLALDAALAIYDAERDEQTDGKKT